jgi:hypothetical protein
MKLNKRAKRGKSGQKEGKIRAKRAKNRNIFSN